MEILAIVPARGKSKGLPGKNIMLLNGHPLISYSILAGQRTKSINRIIVSTDSKEIAEIAKKYNAEIPFMRPRNLAQDVSTDFEVFHYTIKRLKEQENYMPDYVIHLRPTSPIRFISDIEKCIKLIVNNPHADSLRIVTPAQNNPYKMWLLNEEKTFLTPLLKIKGIKEPFNEPRQKLPEVYWQIGTLDIIKTSVIIEQKSMSGKNIIPYIIDNKFAIDIDKMHDFDEAKRILRNNSCIKYDK
ncbi:MAG: acylneuraminate cytidylyltransferase family protein [Mariniphaga sp.]|nr:acylneuraminate cytidylyltransferase family protein [Mariniphaga sp.]